MSGYYPFNKYDYIYKVLVHDMNYCMEWADQDATLDESTWKHGGYCAECGGRLFHKPFDKGGQLTFIMYTSHCYPQCYVHYHKLHVSLPGFKMQGPLEVVALVEQLNSLLVGSDDHFTTISGVSSGEEPNESPPHKTTDTISLG
jgi:hypothetical protein